MKSFVIAFAVLLASSIAFSQEGSFVDDIEVLSNTDVTILVSQDGVKTCVEQLQEGQYTLNIVNAYKYTAAEYDSYVLGGEVADKDGLIVSTFDMEVTYGQPENQSVPECYACEVVRNESL